MNAKTWLEVLDLCISEPTGLAVLCFNSQKADQAKRQLYKTLRLAKTQGNLKFQNLSISSSPHSEEILYVYKNETKNAQEA